MNWEVIYWVVLMLIGFVGSALYSGLETGAYRLNRVMLHIDKQKGNRQAKTIDKLLSNQTTLLSTLLIGNNVTNQLGTASLAVLLSIWGFNDWQSVILNTIIITPILFVFGETLPKDLFAAHADRLVYKLYRVLLISKYLFTWTGLVPTISVFTRALMRVFGGKNRGQVFNLKHQPRNYIEVLVKESVGYGLLSDDISDMAGRVLAMSGMTIEQKMVRWHDVVKVKVDDDIQKLWKLADKSRGSRYPVINNTGTVVGILQLDDALIHEQRNCPSIESMMLKPFQLNSDVSIREGLKALQQHRISMGIVCTKAGKPLGIVTIKDLIEPITGQLKAF
ncbi:DUF21 domain-containing protein [Planctomycetota bacterium]|nr:DUF21 domain-containing protein [Planctomycetota bacterium]